MTDGLLEAARRGVQAGAVRQSLRLAPRSTPSRIDQNAARKARLGRARGHQQRDPRREARRDVARTSSPRSARRARSSRPARRRGVRGLLEAARCRRQVAARRLVLHRRHRLRRRRRRPVRHRPRRRHDHHRRREHLAGRDRDRCLSLHPAVDEVAVVGLAGRALGQASWPPSSSAIALCRTPSWTQYLPRPRALPISSGRAATCSSTRSRSRRSARLLRRKLVAGEYEAETPAAVATPPDSIAINGRKHMTDRRPTPCQTLGSPSSTASVEIDEARARRHHPRPAAAQRGVDAAARPAARCVRGARRGSARARDRAARRGRAFLQRRQHQGLSWKRSPEHVSKLAWNIAAPARCAKPVIAANRGYCFGVGFEISLACDFRIASETTLYALPEQKLGQIPGSGGSARLQKMVGITRTKDIVMRSRRIPAQAGLRVGHRHRMRAGRRAREGDRRAGRRAAHVLAARAAHRQEAAQRHRGRARSSIAIELEGHCYSRLRPSDDFEEGVEAFHAKRPPKFTGR